MAIPIRTLQEQEKYFNILVKKGLLGKSELDHLKNSVAGRGVEGFGNPEVIKTLEKYGILTGGILAQGMQDVILYHFFPEEKQVSLTPETIEKIATLKMLEKSGGITAAQKAMLKYLAMSGNTLLKRGVLMGKLEEIYDSLKKVDQNKVDKQELESGKRFDHIGEAMLAHLSQLRNMGLIEKVEGNNFIIEKSWFSAVLQWV